MTSAGDFIDRDRLEQSLSLDAVINYYVLKGLSEDLKRLIEGKICKGRSRCRQGPAGTSLIWVF